jgi:hypothetical protein
MMRPSRGILALSIAVCAALAGRQLVQGSVGRTAPPGGDGPNYIGLHLPPPRYNAIASNHIFDAAGKIEPRESKTMSFVVPTMDAMDAVLLGDNLRWEFLSPDGSRIIPGVTKESAAYEPSGPLPGFTVNHPARGTWTVSIRALRPDTSAGFAIDVSIDGNAPIMAHIETMLRGSGPGMSTSARPGDVVFVRTFVADRGKPIAGIRWEVTADFKFGRNPDARIRTPNDSTFAIPMYDDGRHADGVAGDGIYVGALRARGPVGLYLLRAAGHAPSGVTYLVTDVVEVGR